MVRCPRCDAPPLDVERVEKVALGKCRRCGLVFDLDKLPARSAHALRAKDPNAPRRLEAPGGLEAWESATRSKVAYRDESGRRGLHITQPWHGSLSVGSAAGFGCSLFLAFCIALAVPLGIIGAMATRHSRFPGGSICLFGPLLPVLYALIVARRNRTEIDVLGDELTIRHVPLWWPSPGGGTYHRGHIDQLWVQQITHKGGRNGQNVIGYSYDLMVVMRGTAREVPIIRGINEPDVALYLEARVEDALGITDRDVGGYLGVGGVRAPVPTGDPA